MKPAHLVLAALAGLAVPSTSWASCPFGELSVWPASGMLAANARIVVTGWQNHRDLVASLADRHPRLEGDKLAVRLEVVESFETGKDGEPKFRNYAVVLAPAVRLKQGAKVRLAFDGLETSTALRPEWTVGPVLEKPLKWNGPLQLKTPCRLVAPVDSEALFVVELSQGGESQRFPVAALRPTGELDVCPSRCGGTFSLLPGRKTAKATALDAGGHSVPAPGAPLAVP